MMKRIIIIINIADSSPQSALARRLLIQIFLEVGKHPADFLRPAKIGDGIGNGVVYTHAFSRQKMRCG